MRHEYRKVFYDMFDALSKEERTREILHHEKTCARMDIKALEWFGGKHPNSNIPYRPIEKKENRVVPSSL